jgi:hypothetical protein
VTATRFDDRAMNRMTSAGLAAMRGT